MRHVAIVLGVSLLAGCGSSLPALNAPSEASFAPRAIAGETLVRLKKGVSPQTYARRHGLQLVQNIGLGIYLFKGARAIDALGADTSAVWAEPNMAFSLPPMKTSTAPARIPGLASETFNDPLLPAQYGVSITGTDRVWPVQKGSPDVVVAVIDSGIDGSHPEFAGQLVPGYDFSEKEPKPGGNVDGYGHGTHVAGVIGAVAGNGIGIAGIAPGCKLMPVRIFNNFGHTTTGGSTAAVIWAVENGAKVINASWGSTLPGQAAHDAYQYALDKDVVFVSAVGNSGKNDSKAYPGASPGVIGVAATNSDDRWASFSTWGDWVSLAAPGHGVLSTYPMAKGNGYKIMDGTSMASPLVAAAAALVRSQYPNMTQAQVKARLEKTAKDVIQSGIDPYSGHGRVDIARAVLDPL
ncbi:Thermophilic serine proteinase precursor [compost metagenome]